MPTSFTLLEYPRVGSHPDSWDQVFSGTCSNGHSMEFTVDDLDNALWELHHLECVHCGEPPTGLDPDEVLVECRFCRESETVPLNLATWAGHRCYGGVESDSLQAVGSSTYFDTLVRDFYDMPPTQSQVHRSRVDYWDLVTHFTELDAFVSILRSQTLEARPTGYFSSRRHSKEVKELSKAVCLTETPHDFVADLSFKFGPVGFCFRKADLDPLGLAPTINLPRHLLERQRAGHHKLSQGSRRLTWVGGLHQSLLPYVNKYDPAGFPYSHEREWRVPADIDLRCTTPWLFLSDALLDALLTRPDVRTREVLEWLCTYGRITTCAAPPEVGLSPPPP